MSRLKLLSPLGIAAILSGGAWTPKRIPNVRLWLSASSVSNLSDGDTVNSAPDLSASGNTISKYSDATRPIYKTNIINGKPVFRFNGTDQLLKVAANASLNFAGPCFFVAVASTDTVTPAAQYAAIAGKASAYIFGQNNAKILLAGQNIHSSDDIFIAGNFEMVAAYFDASYDTTFYSNGRYRSKVSDAFDFPVSANDLYIGGRLGTNRYWDGDIAELLMIWPAPSTDDMNRLFVYLANMYGFPYATDPNVTATNAAAALAIDTYDGSDQLVHPSVYDAGSDMTWNGYRYWMTATPYPGQDDTKENPSIWSSADGDTWVVPDGLTNPVEAYPGVGSHSADPDIIVDSNGVMWLYFVIADGSNTKLYVRSSSDGITWAAKELLLTVAPTELLSPSVVFDGSNYVMWYVNGTTTPKQIERRTCATPNGTWSDPVVCEIYASNGDEPWHIDVVKRGSEYHALVASYTGVLYFATSPDGLKFEFSFYYTMKKTAAGWDNNQLYKSCLVETPTGYDVYYSGVGDVAPGVWKIGRTSITLA